MSRPPAAKISISITLPLTPQVAAYLDELVKTGLFGFSREDAAERLICRAIADAMATVRLADIDQRS